jgi:hypothetical protein
MMSNTFSKCLLLYVPCDLPAGNLMGNFDFACNCPGRAHRNTHEILKVLCVRAGSSLFMKLEKCVLVWAGHGRINGRRPHHKRIACSSMGFFCCWLSLVSGPDRRHFGGAPRTSASGSKPNYLVLSAFRTPCPRNLNYQCRNSH